MSSIRRRLLHVLDVVLRVPPIFIMDSLFVNNMKLSQFYETFVSSTLFDHSPSRGGSSTSSSYMSAESDNNSANVSINYSASLLNNASSKTSHSEGGSGEDFLLLISNTSSIFLVAAYAIGKNRLSAG